MRKEAAEHSLSLNGTSFMSRLLKVNWFDVTFLWPVLPIFIDSADLNFKLLLKNWYETCNLAGSLISQFLVIWIDAKNKKEEEEEEEEEKWF